MSDQAQMQSPQDRLVAFLEAEDGAPQEELREDAPQEVTDESADVEEVSAEAEETPAQRTLRLKWEGQEIEKPEEEVIALAQQGFDYTQKTQKLAEERKAVEMQIQAVKAQEQAFQQQVHLQNAVLQDIAEVTAIDRQLSAFKDVDWNALTDADPVQAQKLYFQYNQLRETRQQKAMEVQQKQQAIMAQQAEVQSKMLQENRARVAAEIPNWGDSLKAELAATAKSYGFNDQEISSVTDPRTVKLLHDAAQWRKLQEQKPTVDKKVASAAPPVKPGAKDTGKATQAIVKDTREKLRKTGRSEYAAQLIERTL